MKRERINASISPKVLSRIEEFRAHFPGNLDLNVAIEILLSEGLDRIEENSGIKMKKKDENEEAS
jgi:hypothetical protein